MRSPTLWDTISPSLSFVALGMKKGGRVWTAWLRGGQLSLGIIYEARTRFWDDTEWEWRFRLRIYLSIYLSIQPSIYIPMCAELFLYSFRIFSCPPLPSSSSCHMMTGDSFAVFVLSFEEIQFLASTTRTRSIYPYVLVCGISGPWIIAKMAKIVRIPLA